MRNEGPPHAVIIRIIIAWSLHARVIPIRSESRPTLSFSFPIRIYRSCSLLREKERKVKGRITSERRENLIPLHARWRASFALRAPSPVFVLAARRSCAKGRDSWIPPRVNYIGVLQSCSEDKRARCESFVLRNE